MKALEITKKQLKPVLDTMKLNTRRQSLKQGIVQDGKLYFIGAGSFVLRYDLQDKNLNGVISFESLEVWYKLHKARDILSAEDLKEMIQDIKENAPLPPQDIEKFFNNHPGEIEYITLNPKFFEIISKAFGTEYIDIDFSGTMKPITFTSNNQPLIKGMLLPARDTRKGI